MTLQRTVYLLSRGAGDARAVRRGRLPARLGNRYKHRMLVRVLKAWGIW